MADAESSDESSSSSQSNETSGGSSQEETPSRGSVGRKKSAQYDDEQASPEHPSTNITYKSVKDKNKVSLKSVDKKTVQQHNKNPKKVNRENRETPSHFTDEFDNRDYQNDNYSTSGGPAAKCDDPPSHVKKSKSDKTGTKGSDKRREKTRSDNDPENRPSNSKTKNSTNENKLNYFEYERDNTRQNTAPRNQGITNHPPKQQERTNIKGRTSNAASKSLESESSESDSDTAEHEHKRGRSKREMTGEGSVSTIKGHKASGSNNHANINNSNVHSDGNRSRDLNKSNNSNFDSETDELQRSTCKKADKSKGKIDDDGYGHDLHRGSNNGTRVACGTNKKKHSKKSNHNKKNAIDENNRRSSDRSSSCSSKGSSSSRNHDKNTSSSLGADRGVESHGGSGSRSSSSGSRDRGSQNCASNSQGRLRGTDKTTTDKRSKKSQGEKETDSDRASKTSRREDRGERPSDRKSRESYDKKGTDSGRASNTSRGEDRNERPSDRKSNESHDKKETDSNRASKTSRREDRSERPSDRKSKESHDEKETMSNCASETSRREDSSERPSGRKSKGSHDKKETKSNRASKTSRREDSSERPSDHSERPSERKSKESREKKETKSNRASKTSRREDSSERPSDHSESASVHSESASDHSERPSDRKSKGSHDKKETKSNQASKTSRHENSSERPSDHRERPSDRKSKGSHDKKETKSNRASKTSRREDSSERPSDHSERPSDRKSKGSHDKKETKSNRASKTSRREDSSGKPSDRNSKKSHDVEGNYKKKTKGNESRRDGKKDERKAKRSADSSGSSSERRRSRSKDKSRDKERHREKEKYEHMDKKSDRYHSSNSHNREENRGRGPADIHKKNARETFRDRHNSRDHSEEEEWNRGRKSRACASDSGKYRDSPEGNERTRRKYYDEDSNEREAKYEWQFENEHGNWITYGQSNTGRPLQGADVVTSDDIEQFYSKHRDTKKPLLIEANSNQYFLNFNEMSQTNVKTSVRRRIRRVRQSEKHNHQSQKYNEDYHYGDGRASSNFGRLSGHPPDPKDNQPTRKNDSSTKFEWQFEDDTTGHWITYGKTNSGKDRNTSTTSDDIEKYHARDPSKGTMQIRSGRDQYLLNFKQMTEVDIETLGRRRVRRVAKSSWGIQSLVQWLGWSRPSLSGSRDTDVDKYEWQFQDERGVWITYGQASSNGITAFSTAASSDDIESYYSSTPDKAPIIISSRTHTYVLDFSKMVQINQETLVQRKIQRVKKTSNGSKTNQQGGVGQSGVTAGNGTNAGVNNFPNPSNNPAYVGYGAGNASHSFNQRDPRVNVGGGQHLNPPSFPCVWQFQDENGSWITYGQPSSTNQMAGSTTTSDDIEQYFSTNPGKTSMIIRSRYNQYVLDFQSMVQINQQTQAQKPVRRVMKQNIQPPPNFQQGF